MQKLGDDKIGTFGLRQKPKTNGFPRTTESIHNEHLHMYFKKKPSRKWTWISPNGKQNRILNSLEVPLKLRQPMGITILNICCTEYDGKTR